MDETPSLDLPRGLVATFLSLAVHGAVIGGCIAYALALDWLSPPQGPARKAAVISAELVTRERTAVSGIVSGDAAEAPNAAPPATTGPAPAAASAPPASQASAGQDGYFARLREHLAAYREAPRGGLAGGTATIGFLIEGDGHVERIRLAGTSGDAQLDRAALALVARASPVPRPPQNRPLAVEVPVEFR